MQQKSFYNLTIVYIIQSIILGILKGLKSLLFLVASEVDLTDFQKKKKKSLILCKLMRKQPHSLLDLLPQYALY